MECINGMYGIPVEEYLSYLQDELYHAKREFYKRCGADYYESVNGFTVGQLYSLAGREDRVVTMSFKHGSELSIAYCDGITASLVYTQSERRQLELNNACFDDNDEAQLQDLLVPTQSFVSIKPSSVFSLIIMPQSNPNNTYISKKARTIPRLEIPFEQLGNGRDIRWMYDSLKRFLADNVAITPEEYSRYLAYKMILEYDNLTEVDRERIFDADGCIKDQYVALYYYRWRVDAFGYTKENIRGLNIVGNICFDAKMSLLNDELIKMGLSIGKMQEKFPEKLKLLMLRTIKFQEQRYNITGRNLLYMNYKTFLHIYLRHVEEITVENQFAERDKFQLVEEDVFVVMKRVLQSINEHYQTWKTNNPDREYLRYGHQAIYYNGDYYNVKLRTNGQNS